MRHLILFISLSLAACGDPAVEAGASSEVGMETEAHEAMTDEATSDEHDCPHVKDGAEAEHDCPHAEEEPYDGDSHAEEKVLAEDCDGDCAKCPHSH